VFSVNPVTVDDTIDPVSKNEFITLVDPFIVDPCNGSEFVDTTYERA
jgi:hypothetical protein